MEYGRTLLHCAAMTGKLEICKYLIEDRVNLHPKDKGGATPLGYAIQYGHLDVCKLIIQNFNDKNPTSKAGWSKAIETGMILLIMLFIFSKQTVLTKASGNSRQGRLGFNGFLSRGDF